MSLRREEEYRFHPILERSWEYEIVSFCFHRGINDEFESYLDLTLSNGGVSRDLRFLSPRDIQIEEGFPIKTGGLVILDVSDRGLENINVKVDDFEATRGAVVFWARSVEELFG